MRVLQLIDSLEAGGAERIAVTYANLLSKEMNSFLCVTRSEGSLKNTIGEKVNYLFLNKKNTLDIKAIFKLRSFVKEEKIQLIQAHSSSFFLATLVKLMCFNLKVVWHDHYGNSENLKQRKSFILQKCSHLFNATIAVNLNLKNWAINHLHCKKVMYLPNFVSTEVNNNQITKLNGTNGKRIVCLANLRAQKDHINLLKSFQKILINKTDWTLHLVGKNFNDLYASKVNKYIRNNNLQHSVFVYGSCTDVDAILQSCQIGVLSSKSEGLPVSLLEYGKNKLSVVVTDVGECNKVVTDQINGLVVPSNDPIQLANAVLDFIDNPNKANQFALKFNNYILHNYSEQAIVSDIIKLYKTLLS